MPEASLPTFDSGHIESWIHHIPGLSERYFYLNDDVFFGAPVRVQDWFHPKGFHVTWSDDPMVTDEAMRMDATSLENACRLSIQWLTDKARSGTPALREQDRSPGTSRRSACPPPTCHLPKAPSASTWKSQASG